MAVMEYNGRTQEEAFNAIRDKIRKNTELILERSAKEEVSPRRAAVALAKERVLRAMSYRRI